MNIENLSDTELNLAMIWCYPSSRHIRYTQYQDGTLKGYYHADLKAAFYNHLTDFNLTMPLAVKHKIELSPFTYEEGVWRAYQIKRSTNNMALSKNPLRAICCVLVQIALTKA